MSLNKIQLQPQLLASLYGNSLSDSGTSNVPDAQVFKYLGDNRKNIFLIVNHPSAPFLPDEELSFLTTILNACRLSLSDVGIVNYSLVSLAELQEAIEKDARTIILFGIDPLSIGLPINFPQFQLQQFNNRMYLYSPTLTELGNDKTLKAKLWNALKTLFGI
jgi:hypothetical protein